MLLVGYKSIGFDPDMGMHGATSSSRGRVRGNNPMRKKERERRERRGKERESRKRGEGYEEMEKEGRAKTDGRDTRRPAMTASVH